MLTKIKICAKCKNEKALNNFHKKKDGRLGVKAVCKMCLNGHQKSYYNPEKAKAYRTTNQKKIKAYRKSNKEKNNIYQKNRRRKNPSVKLSHSVSVGMWKSLNKNKKGYHWETLVGYTLEDLKKHIQKKFTKGMTWTKYLNGEIHIDHKIPISVFNFTESKHEDFKKCWALKNLQPMWAIENLEKNDKLYKHFQPSLMI